MLLITANTVSAAASIPATVEEYSEELTVEVSAVLVIDDQIAPLAALKTDLAYKGRTDNGSARGGGSIASAEIFGKSLLDRTVEHLRNAGIESVVVVAGQDLPSSRTSFRRIVAERPCERWPAAQQEVIRQNARGIATVLMIGVNAYVEWDVRNLLNFHRSTGAPLTQLQDAQGPVDLWAVETEWFCTAALGCTLPFRYGEFPGLPVPCRIEGYVNRLANAADLRQLVEAGFHGHCGVRPAGREVRPGVWIEEGARVHKLACLIAPVYVGRSTTVGAGAVISGFSNVEHHSVVGEGTTVHSSSVLCYTRLSTGLEVFRAVIEGNTLVDVRRNIALCVRDPQLIRDMAGSRWKAPNRTTGSTADFAYPSFFYRAAGRLSEVLFRNFT